jgi:RND family efflux transporter MFP subunit
MPMKKQHWLVVGIVTILCFAPAVTSSLVPPAPQAPQAVNALAIEVPGRTQCIAGRIGIIAPVPLHPVDEVLVAPGDRVKKGQPLIKIDPDEQEAEVRAKQAMLESSGVALKEARRRLAAIERERAVFPDHIYQEANANALKAEKDQLAARANLESARAELEHYTVVAPIDGVVNRLDVYVGMVSRPGTTVWGEVIDLREIDVRCELTPEQADRVSVGQAAEVRTKGKNDSYTGKVAFVGFSADKSTGLVPVLVRLANPSWRLRCEIPVQVRFLESTGSK